MSEMTPIGTGLNPVQESVLAVLEVPADQRPVFPRDIRITAKERLEDAINDKAPKLADGDHEVFFNKHRLSGVLGCEEKFLAERFHKFEWNTKNAVGTVSHKALELAFNMEGGINANDLADAAVEQLVMDAVEQMMSDNESMAAFLQDCSEADMATLKSGVVERVSKIVECFPPINNSMNPVTETRLAGTLLGGKVRLSGVVDLVLNPGAGEPAGAKEAVEDGESWSDKSDGDKSAEADDGLVANKVIIDFKTGWQQPNHRDDLRFYALLETMRSGVPPRLLMSLYLDDGDLSVEEVSQELLDATIRRVADAIGRHQELTQDKTTPKKNTGPPCNWCTLQVECEEGTKYLEERTNYVNA